ncbi:MAG: DUF4126 domain-containing protein [Gammaproteobacteria bacterium]|nr:DUF4126 domain-containing protein [Gammaproteobacteria bacterium]
MIPHAALAAAVAWGAGLRLYLVLFVLGLLHRLEVLQLPPALEFLQHPLIMGVTGLFALAEFVGDKLPWLDSLSDAVHTLIRIPAGAALAAAFFADGSAAVQALALLLGASIAAGTHIAKAGGRAMINASPEPVSNVAASLGEEAVLVSGGWLALFHPLVFLLLLALFLLAVAVFLRRLWRALRARWPRAA